ncbi:DUF1361 domain-containing protein [Flavobacterium selenitireducens]|uniref:DUF1361 domain-containing protein n=1 Tax=Flavobacterium selenitireducens TaxID=2722704 RepID=UPI00168B3715|nr:DUF1361 domain-containing protein [Flavobacterium selenitireducens]MBD3581229.1 DUF1361 domain-containing protein [Flavobacterium selenitireducens]
MKIAINNSLYVSVLPLVGFNFLLIAFRMFVTSGIGFGFLIWNLVLSLVPLCISLYLTSRGTSTLKIAIGSLIWLLFLPNAPYILTDFLHFRKINLTMPAWFDLLLLASYSISGLLFGLLSMWQMHQVWKKSFGNISDLMIPASALLSGFGIYLGRYERYNSWDVLSDPIRILHDSAVLLIELRTIGFTIGYGTLLLLVYYFIRLNSQRDQNP